MYAVTETMFLEFRENMKNGRGKDGAGITQTLCRM
jgi:hypothetical protein